MIDVRRFRDDEWAAYRAMRLRALADTPDAFGSTLAAEELLPDASWQERLTAAAHSPLQLPLVAELSGELVGLVWSRVDAARPHIAHVYQMWVAPEGRGHGVGTAMLSAVIAWAKAERVEWLDLSVTAGNSVAYRLYTRMGFAPHGPLKALRPNSPLSVQPMRLELRTAH